MIRMKIQERQDAGPCGCGEHHHESAWGANIQGGLFIQKHTTPAGIVYGITHHSGLVVAPTYYSYNHARVLQERLLALPIDWTQSAETLKTSYKQRPPAMLEMRMILVEWEDMYATWNEETLHRL